MPAPLLIALPSNLIVSGVATWAARLVSALAEAGRVVGLIVHAPPAGHARLDIGLHPAVRVYDLTHLGSLEHPDIGSGGDGSALAMGHATGESGQTGDCGLFAPVALQSRWTGGTREAFITAYVAAIRDLYVAGGGTSPVVVSPNLHADCYAVCLEAARREPHLVRLVGWQHNDIEYDRRVLAHYEAALAALVGVSDHITSLLRTRMPGREVASVPYGVEVSGAPPRRTPLMGAGGPRPVRLLYTGRLDHHQKRILALPHMSRALVDMGIEHQLTVMGDGPAAADLDRLIDEGRQPQRHKGHRERQDSEAGVRTEPLTRLGLGRTGRAAIATAVSFTPTSATPALDHDCASESASKSNSESGLSLCPLCLCGDSSLPIRRTGPASPVQVREALAHHDAFILPSRFEGLSVSMLEALAAGCVPIVARVESGALQAIKPGVTGLIADVAPEADEHAVGIALAQEVARFLACDAAAMSRAAWASARERYGLETHARHVAELVDHAAKCPPIEWPADRPVWFSELGGSIPLDAPQRLARVLEQLAGRRVVVHATGLHTRALLAHLLAGPAVIVGFTDDDRQRHGQSLGGLPIIAPDAAGTLGATDVVISTSMHEDAVWARRDVYERLGFVVHRLYA